MFDRKRLSASNESVLVRKMKTSEERFKAILDLREIVMCVKHFRLLLR